MNEIDKLIELIKNKEGLLAFTIALGLNCQHELLDKYWDKYYPDYDDGMLHVEGIHLEFDYFYCKWYVKYSIVTEHFHLNSRNKAFKLFIDEINKRIRKST